MLAKERTALMYWEWIASDMQSRCLDCFEKYFLFVWFFTVVLFFKQSISIGSHKDTQFLTMTSGVVFAITETSL